MDLWFPVLSMGYNLIILILELNLVWPVGTPPRKLLSSFVCPKMTGLSNFPCLGPETGISQSPGSFLWRMVAPEYSQQTDLGNVCVYIPLAHS